MYDDNVTLGGKYSQHANDALHIRSMAEAAEAGQS